jgi:2-polyprenyl-3-methyl-5-hydroxy-6-metoxy-1,4-benzoquinol methylase
MTARARNQDFEAYADEKSFNYATNPVWDAIIDEYIAAHVRPAAAMKVFDDGCGDGKLYPALVAKGFLPDNIHGVEVSQTRIQRCHQIGFENAIYLPLHSKRPYDDRMFDLINYMEVIEHVPAAEIDFYLSEMARILKKDGMAVITTPNYPVKRVIDFYDAFVHRRWMRLRDDPTHVTFYTYESLKRRLEKFFGHVDVRCYKEGLFYKRWKKPFLMHKLVAVCKDPR